MISYQEALDIVLKQAQVLPTHTLAINDALHFVCAETVKGNEAIPPFNNSAMDGFAVCADDTKNATAENPVRLAMVGSTVAGDTPASNNDKKANHTAWEIMTGAAVPNNYDTVVMIEQVEITQRDAQQRPTEISISAALKKGSNIRLAGEDFKPDDILIEAGTRVAPEHITVMAALGVKTINVFAQPRTTILSTGKELVDDGALKPGQIRNSNGPYLYSALTTLHSHPSRADAIPDDPTAFEDYIKQCSRDADIIISTGAVSAGSHDFIPNSLKNLGAEILFHKVSMRPGKPILFARLPDGTYYFGLPGNPVSAAVGLRFFVTPLLRALQGLPIEQYPHAALSNTTHKKPALRFFQKAHVEIANDGKCVITILTGQESFKLKPLLSANAWAILPEGEADFNAGMAVQFAPLYTEQLLLTDRN